MHVLAIDQGTSSTKALVLGPEREILGSATAAVTPRASPDGEVIQDPQELLDSVVEAGRAALHAAGVPVDAVGLGNQGETVLAWDRATGRPLGPALSWQDRRAGVIARALEPQAERLTAITGLPLDPYFAGCKLAWVRRRPDTPADAAVTTIDAWVNHQLTGAFVTDVATASRTLLLDLDGAAWSHEACEIFELDAGEQPAIRANAEPVGETRAFGAPVPVTGLCVDQQAALFAESCWEAGAAKCTYGTGAFLLAHAGRVAPRSSAGLSACVAWRLHATDVVSYCLDGQVYTAGAAVSWLRRLGLLKDPSELDAGAASGPPPPNGPLFVPALAGIGSPHWAPDARAGWLGLSLATERRDLIDAVLWGVAAEVAGLAAAMRRDLGRPVEALRVDGGLTRSRRLMQAQADLLQAPVEVYPSPDATALGIGALARIGAGGAADPAAAVGAWTAVTRFEPSIGADRADEILSRQERATRALIELAAGGR